MQHRYQFLNLCCIRRRRRIAQVGLEFFERCLTITYEQLRSVPRVVAVAGGASKAGAIRAVARAGLITELVTDHTLALEIVEGADA